MTELLSSMRAGDHSAFDALLRVVYEELRRMARGHLRRERGGHTLSPTALVHEAYLRLAAHHAQRWENRAHFFGAASNAMRRILVDYARGRAAKKRQAERVGVTDLDTLGQENSVSIDGLLQIDDALGRLAQVHERLARVVECRYFGGLSIPETAEALGVSHTTVSEDWRFARAWLQRALTTGCLQAPNGRDAVR
jgi:RNA polymerase sigma factor (TIGR02999 family)